MDKVTNYLRNRAKLNLNKTSTHQVKRETKLKYLFLISIRDIIKSVRPP
jgi:hypothetical protein